MAETRWSKEI